MLALKVWLIALEVWDDLESATFAGRPWASCYGGPADNAICLIHCLVHEPFRQGEVVRLTDRHEMLVLRVTQSRLSFDPVFYRGRVCDMRTDWSHVIPSRYHNRNMHCLAQKLPKRDIRTAKNWSKPLEDIRRPTLLRLIIVKAAPSNLPRESTYIV